MPDEGRRRGLGCWGVFFIACLAVLFMRTCCPGTCTEEDRHEATAEEAVKL